MAVDLVGEKSAKLFMPASLSTHPVTLTPSFAESFFAPARTHLDQAPSARVCPALSDDQWLLPGVRRALEDRPTGRSFLQHLTANHFFETLKSARRLALIAEVSHGLARSLPALGVDFWGAVPELDGFEIPAGDGHFHAAAAHDTAAADDGVKYATGHFFTLNLRTHGLVHLTASDQLARKREHDSFDELKNKLGETKAWASTANAKAMQAHFLGLAHNLMILCEAELARVHGVRNEAELAWRRQRLEKEEQRLAEANRVPPLLVRTLQRLTVRSVKFIRWLRVQLFLQPHRGPAVAALRQLYAVL